MEGILFILVYKEFKFFHNEITTKKYSLPIPIESSKWRKIERFSTKNQLRTLKDVQTKLKNRTELDLNYI